MPLEPRDSSGKINRLGDVGGARVTDMDAGQALIKSPTEDQQQAVTGSVAARFLSDHFN
jgi:hypothetical protein